MATMALVVNVGLDWVLNQLQAGITHLVVGDSAAPITGAEVQLGNELFRRPITDTVKIDRSLFVDTRVASTEANFHWQEVGLVVGGTEAAGTGTLVCRVLLDYDHTAISEAATVSVELIAQAK